MGVDQELVSRLAVAVRETFEGEGRPLSGTRLGHVLRESYRDKGLSTGPGAYKPVMDEAVRQNLIKKVWRGDRVSMALIPAGVSPPPEWMEHPGKEPTPGPENQPLGFPLQSPYLRRDLFKAFTGRSGPAWLDVRNPPNIRVLSTRCDDCLEVEVLPAQTVRKAWEEFAERQAVDVSLKEEIGERLGGDPWARVSLPGELGHQARTFHRQRLQVLVEHVRHWFTRNQLNASEFLLAQGPRRELDQGSTTHGGVAKRNDVGALRERLKRIIDQMSVEQLYQLRIPAEYLDH